MPLSNYRIFADCRCTVGENPLWMEKEKALYWVDLTEGNIYRKIDDTPPNEFEKFEIGIGKIGGMVKACGGGFLLFGAEGTVWRWRLGREAELLSELPAAEGSRFNDVISSPDGGVYCGVAPSMEKSGSLWHFDRFARFSCIEPDLKGMPNGMGFSPDRSSFYLTVSDEKKIYRYDYNPHTGKLSNRKTLINVPKGEGIPDGLTVDISGNIWSAQWNGHRIVKYSPDGGKIGEYLFPMEKVTSLAFGGDSCDKIFITTANYPWAEDSYNLLQSGAVLEMSSAGVGMNEYEANLSVC